MDKKMNFVLGMLSGVVLAVILWVVITPVTNATEGPRAASASATEINGEEVLQKLNHLHQIIETQYIGEFDLELAIEMMFAGFVYAAGDPYTVYMNTESFERFSENTAGAFVGIGVSITTDIEDNRITVIAPFEGSPAFNAGILPGDKIIRVDGTEVFGAEGMNDAIRMMRGVENTEVIVTIFRGSDNSTFDLPIIRDVIQVETVRSSMINDDIGYIRITQFDANTYDRFKAEVENLQSQGMNGLIIDVRNNPGGLLHIVNQITNMLIPEGIVTYTEFADGRRQYANSDANYLGIPLAVLVNGNSASASEILSGAVLDTGMGAIVGTTTFGKGLVQNIFPLNDGSALKVTVARYYTPSGISIQGEGVTPTHYVEMPIELTNNLSSLEIHEDIQLLEALQIVNEKLGR